MMKSSDCHGKTDREILLYLLRKQEALVVQLKRRPCIHQDELEQARVS